MTRLDAPSSSACEIAVSSRGGIVPGNSSSRRRPLAAALGMPLAASIHAFQPIDPPIAIEQDEPEIDGVEDAVVRGSAQERSFEGTVPPAVRSMNSPSRTCSAASDGMSMSMAM